MEWNEIRKISLSSYRPDEWPEGVYGISMEGLSLLGVHKEDNRLFWDGKEIQTKAVVTLRGFELILATMAAGSTLGIFLVSLGEVLGWFA